MKRFKNYLKQFIKKDDGGPLMEYVILVGLIILVAVVVVAIVNVIKDKGMDAKEKLEGIGADDGVIVPDGEEIAPPVV